MHGPEILVPLGFFAMVTAISIGVPFVRALARRIDRESKSPGVTPEIAARLERMEQAIDSIAVEVERISEGQRFTTRLLSTRAEGAAGVADGARPAQVAGERR